jgi:hypothetical protein
MLNAWGGEDSLIFSFISKVMRATHVVEYWRNAGISSDFLFWIGNIFSPPIED